MRVAAIASAAWITKSPTVISRPVVSFGSMLNSGIKTCSANALSIATGAVTAPRKAIQPNAQPTLGLASRDAHA